MESVPALPKVPTRVTLLQAPQIRLSKLEQLPAEIRLEVYGHLGYPIGKNVWITCQRRHGRGPWPCLGRGHHDHGGPLDKNKGWDSTKYQTPIDRLVLCSATAIHSPYKNMAFHVNKDDKVAEAMPMVTALLCVNHFLRNDLLQTLFGKNEVEFQFPPSTQAIYTDRSYHDLHRFQMTIPLLPMRILPSTLSHMTSITLSVGGTTWVRGDAPLLPYVHSLNLIANNCPRLKSLRFEPRPGLSHYYDYTEQELDQFAAAMGKVFQRCMQLETIRLGSRICRRGRYFVESLDLGDCVQQDVVRWSRRMMLMGRNIYGPSWA